MADWETKFEGATERARRGARLIAGFAEERGLERTDDRQKSVIWGTPARDMLWCFPEDAEGSGRTGGVLELELGHLDQPVADSLRDVLPGFGAPQPLNPKIAWGTVVARWDELRSDVPEPYVDALSRT